MDNQQPPVENLEAFAEDVRLVSPMRKTFLERIVRMWIILSGPSSQQFGISIEEKELFRRSRLLSSLFFLFIVVILLTIPTAIPVPTYWVPIGILFFFGIIALILNRKKHITASGIVCILAIEATLIVLFIILPNGIRNSNIPDFDFFILPVLIAGILLPRIFLPFLAFGHILIIVAIFSLLPHDPILTQEILVNQKGVAYSELSDAITIQIVGATIAWLSSRSVDRALIRASRAEELAATRERLNKQAQQILAQKERLEYGITILKEAQARFANGDYKARARLSQNELVPLATSFNLMAERLTRVVHVEHEYKRLEQAIEYFLQAQDSFSQETSGEALRTTGTLLDRLYPLVKRYRMLRHLTTRSNATVEQVRTHLNQQKNQFSQLDVDLNTIHSWATSYTDTTRQSRSMLEELLKASYGQPSDTSPSGPLANFNDLIERVEAAQQHSAQANELNKQCSNDIKLLGQWLTGIPS
jgi:tetratricopeptide (TPR) repeat protein